MFQKIKTSSLFIFAITFIITISPCYAKTHIITGSQLLPFSEDLTQPKSTYESYVYNSSNDENGLTSGSATIDIKKGQVIKKFIVYIKVNHPTIPIYPLIGYIDYKTGAVTYLNDGDPESPDELAYTNLGSEINKINVSLNKSNHIANPNKYQYFIAISIGSGGGTEVAFYGAKVVTK